MSLQLAVLASGSSGNACLLRSGDRGLLLDCGLGPRLLAARLATFGFTWKTVRAAALTHTHSDHWSDRTFAQLRAGRVPCYCRPEHAEYLAGVSPGFVGLLQANLVRHYYESPFRPLPEYELTPHLVSHDCPATYAFRIEYRGALFGGACSLGYLTDLGTWDEALAAQFTDVDLLALEFNHDENLQLTSGRPQVLIQRVLGPRGHLSNAQAAAFVRAVQARSTPERLQHIVQLHLSRECNTVEHAELAGRTAAPTAAIHPTFQGRPGPLLDLALPALQPSS